jgi:hypothetical protein
MRWRKLGVKAGLRVVLPMVVVVVLMGCAPIQMVTPSAADATAEATSESTGEATTEATTEPTGEDSTDATAEPIEEPTTTDSATYDDPFAYCAAVGTIDEPDAQYTGPELPDSIVEGLRDAFNAQDVDLEVFQRGSVWRCMDAKVYACNVGANIPCLAKADLSQEPTEPMADYCQENADSDFIPAVVTGRETIYEWRCDGTTPVVGDPYTEADSQGFLEFAWHELTPPQ